MGRYCALGVIGTEFYPPEPQRPRHVKARSHGAGRGIRNRRPPGYTIISAILRAVGNASRGTRLSVSAATRLFGRLQRLSFRRK